MKNQSVRTNLIAAALFVIACLAGCGESEIREASGVVVNGNNSLIFVGDASPGRIYSIDISELGTDRSNGFLLAQITVDKGLQRTVGGDLALAYEYVGEILGTVTGCTPGPSAAELARGPRHVTCDALPPGRIAGRPGYGALRVEQPAQSILRRSWLAVTRSIASTMASATATIDVSILDNDTSASQLPATMRFTP